VVLRGNKNQAWASFRGLLLWSQVRSAAKGMQDADDSRISGNDANADGYDYSKAENQRHEERNHGQPPLS